ncbi:MAG: hypothetical protein FWG63_11070 [Defluviitaleaceae bacterium]|nr:hypothetical protein [Defluviitaleaceae bacterium]
MYSAMYSATTKLNKRENTTLETHQELLAFKKPYKHKTLRQRVEEFYGVDFETVIKENLYDFEEIPYSGPVGQEV